MSDEVVNNVNQAADQAASNVSGEASNTPDMSNLTGEQAVALAEEAKASGKTVEELFLEKGGNFNMPNREPETKEEAFEQAVEEVKRKLKIGDQEVDEDEVIKVFKNRKQHQQAANKILQEGKAARKQAEEFINMMKDPNQFWKVAEKMGYKPRDLAESFLVEKLKDDMLDPRERELRDAKLKLQQYQQMEEQQRKMVEQRRLEEMKQKYVKDYETQFVSALQESNLPPTKPMIAEMAKYISRSAKIGFKMTPLEAAQLVKEDVKRAQMNLIGNADGETLLKLFGDDVAKKILTARGSKVKNPQYSTPAQQGTRQIEKKDAKRAMTNAEWRAYNRKK